MLKMLVLATALVVMIGAAHADTIYRCEIDGRLVFSQQPCAEDAERVEVEIREAAPSEIMRSHDPTFVNRVQLDRQIQRHRSRVREMQQSRDRDLATLRARQRTAMNNLAGANYLQSLAAEMQAITDSYESRIQVEQREIDRLQARLDALAAR